MKNYVKLISAVLGGISTWGYTAASTDGISAVEWFGLVGVLGTAFAVYQFPNVDEKKPRKRKHKKPADEGHVDSSGLVLGLILGIVLTAMVFLLRR